jgi:hypothetical protein
LLFEALFAEAARWLPLVSRWPTVTSFMGRICACAATTQETSASIRLKEKRSPRRVIHCRVRSTLVGILSCISDLHESKGSRGKR